MEKIKERLAVLRIEADNAIARAVEAESKAKRLEQQLAEKERDNTSLQRKADALETRAESAEAKNKKLDQILLEKSQEITSLQHRLTILEVDLGKTEKKLTESKARAQDAESGKAIIDALQRKVQLLEKELDAAEKNSRSVVEKLRQVDVKAEHYERHIQRLEQERDQWEKKYEEAQEKQRRSKQEMDELMASMESL